MRGWNMQRKDEIRLQHILDEAGEVLQFVKGYSFDGFKKDSKTVHAVLRAIEVMGEAASKISPEYKNIHSHVPWNQIVGMRNHLVHVYFDVDYDTVWKTVQEDIPHLIRIVEELLSKQ